MSGTGEVRRGRHSKPPKRASRDLDPIRDVGRLISGRYRIEERLGKGGTASVWRAHDEVTDQKLALKTLSPTAKATHVRLFEREYHTLAGLRHPCIVEVLDYASDEGGPYYTMELLDGSDVQKLAPKPWPEVCRILRDVASGLALLHARRLVHRDVSPTNIWLTHGDQTKLIDFGTMATFGSPGELAGTPPFIAPEALHGRDLDQRTDLYSLGAVGYFLLTGRYAFPARRMADLESVWQQRPRPVSLRVTELGRPDLPEVPPALETLVHTLLSHDPLGRPATAADVIDRLTAIASLESDRQERVLESYLSRPPFVGREAEREALRTGLTSARSGEAAAAVVESQPGLGRTRLLQEFAVEARLAGASVLEAGAHGNRETHEVAHEFALRLLAALPDTALEAAAPHARTLGHLSPRIRERLGLPRGELADMPKAHGEARMRVQAALRDWFLDVAREHPLVVIADNLEAFDDGSAAWLASLAREAKSHKLLVVASLGTDQTGSRLAIQALCQSAQRMTLEPLSAEQTMELFRGVFGDVQHLARFVDLVHRRAEGNPGHAIDIAEHLSHEDVISYADGAWVLPQTIPEDALPADRLGAEVARLGRLPMEARRLGQAMSVRQGVISLDMCAKLAEIENREVFDNLEALVRENVLAGSADGYRFSRDSLRRALNAELDEARRALAHRHVGAMLLAKDDFSELERLEAGVHLLRGGDHEAGSREVAAAGKHYGLVDLADLGPAAPWLEVALDYFRESGRPPHELASVLAPLALAGYYSDRRFATRYGKEAVDVLETLVGLKTARRLRRFLGRKPGLLAAMSRARGEFALRSRNPRIPTFREAVMMLFNCVAALTGVCTVCVDPASGLQYASVLEPMRALGREHVATFMHEFCLNLVATVQDRPGDARASWLQMIDRLDRPDEVKDLPENVYSLYLAGALYAVGVLESYRDDSKALHYAERLERLNLKLYNMSADQVRMMYYANRANMELFEHYRGRVEVHAIQRGTAWQVETWTFSGLTKVYVRLEDAAGLKECAEHLKRLSTDVPSLVLARRRAHAAYLVVRGMPSEALELLGVGEEPLKVVGWAQGEGLRARAQNALGGHERARETALAALARHTDEDLNFCALSLGVQIELARAEAGLGNLERAENQLHTLLRTHEPAGNPLTVGALNEALADVAALRDDEQAFRGRVAEVERWFRDIRHPSLVARCERLAADISVAPSSPVDEDATEPTTAREPHMMTVVHKLRHGGDHTLAGSVEWILKQVSEFVEVEEAYLFLIKEGEVSCAGRSGPADTANELAEWVADRLEAHRAPGTLATQTASGDAEDPDRTEIGDRFYYFTPLLAPGNREEKVIGALVFPTYPGLPYHLVRTIAERLRSTVGVSGGDSAQPAEVSREREATRAEDRDAHGEREDPPPRPRGT